MKSITWQEIEQIAEAGDVLYGDFECLNWIWDNEKKDYQKVIEKTNKLVFWECISCLTDKEDVRKGAKIFEHNDEIYEIVDNNPTLGKLKQLEDLEDEIGIDLITLFKALTNGFFAKDVTMYHLTGELSENQKLDPKYLRLNMWYGCIEWENIWNPMDDLHEYYFKDYGKTWALTKEELEEEK